MPRAQRVVRAVAHAARQQHLTVGQRLGHQAVAAAGSRVVAMLAAVMVMLFRSDGELAMMRLGAFFLAGDLSVFNRKHQIVPGAAKMGRDGLEVVGDDSDLHGAQISFGCVRR